MEPYTAGHLLEILTKENDIYAELHSYSDRKRAAVVAGDLETLGDMTRTETALSERLAELEKERVLAAEALAARYGLPREGLNLRLLAGKVEDPALRARLTEMRERVSEAVGKLVKTNQLMKQLVEQKRSYARAMLGALLQSGPVSGTYDQSGSYDAQPLYGKVGLFDQHA